MIIYYQVLCFNSFIVLKIINIQKIVYRYLKFLKNNINNIINNFLKIFKMLYILKKIYQLFVN